MPAWCFNDNNRDVKIHTISYPIRTNHYGTGCCAFTIKGCYKGHIATVLYRDMLYYVYSK